MAKSKTVFLCNSCGYESPGWLGRCPSCREWNTFVEEKTASAPKETRPSRQAGWTESKEVVPLSTVPSEDKARFSSGLRELDRILGGGFVAGSLVLVGGDPGIGKSTLLLQVSHLARSRGDVLYVSGEESGVQIRMRAERLGVDTSHITLCTQTSFETVSEVIGTQKPALCIIDSIQTLYTEEMPSAPGSVGQVREVTAGLLRLAKHLETTIVLVGHVTKDGSLAGPRVLEHMVDTVLYFEGESNGPYRMLRAVKNRFGATGELAFFEMTGEGLCEVESASTLLLSGRPLRVPGSVVTSCLEGTRAVLVEIQALLNPSAYAVAQRLAQGLDRGRIGMLLAVLEKHFSAGINNMDAYINVVGGLRLSEPACDLAILAAVFSALKDRPVRPSTLILGEVGLTGEIRPVSRAETRLSEALRLGFTTAVLPGGNKDGIDRLLRRIGDAKTSLAKNPAHTEILAPAKFPECVYVDTLSEAMDILFTGGNEK